MRDGNRSLRTTRALVALVVVVGLVIVTGAWQVLAARRGITEQVRAGNEALARAAAAAVGAEMETQIDRVRFFAARPELPEIIGSDDRDAMQRAVDFVGILYPDFASASIIGANGTILAHWPDPSETVGDDLAGTSGFESLGAARVPVVGEPVTLPGTKQGVTITAGLRAPDGVVVGYLRLGYPITHLQAIQADIGVTPDGSMMLLDEHGRLLTGLAVPAERIEIPADGMARYGNGDLRLPDRDGVRLVGWSRVPGTTWTVVVEQPRARALGNATSVATRMGIIVLLVSLVAAMAAGFLGRLLRQLTRERNRSRAILASIADGAVTTNAEGRIRTMNATMQKMTGWSVADAAGRHISEVVELRDGAGARLADQERMLPQAIETREPVASRGFDLTIDSREGVRTPVGITAAPILSDEGELIGGVAVYRDVSYERELDEMKSALVSTVSHELRTPLTMIQGFSELLLERDVDAERSREAVGYISSSAKRLARLIEDLLQVSHLDAGRVAFDVVDTDLAVVIEEALAPFRSRHATRNFTVEIGDVPPVAGDADMIVRIVNNLVSNAVKYSPDGTRIRLRARCDDDRVIVDVIDHGIGMSDDEARRLFDKFFRSSHPDVQRAGGSGLGLYITRGLVRLQGGQIWASSEPGRGSTFSFSLPVAGTRGPQQRERETSSA